MDGNVWKEKRLALASRPTQMAGKQEVNIK